MSSSRTISSKVYADLPPRPAGSARDHGVGIGEFGLIYSEAIFRVAPLGGEPPREGTR